MKPAGLIANLFTPAPLPVKPERWTATKQGIVSQEKHSLLMYFSTSKNPWLTPGACARAGLLCRGRSGPWRSVPQERQQASDTKDRFEPLARWPLRLPPSGHQLTALRSQAPVRRTLRHNRCCSWVAQRVRLSEL